MKILVVWYSRTGHVKRMAGEISTRLNSDTDSIIDNTNRKGMWGWFMAARDAIAGNPTDITVGKKPDGYDMVVLGTPIWAGHVPPPIVAYIDRFHPRRYALFSSCGGDPKIMLEEMTGLAGEPKAFLCLTQSEQESSASLEKIYDFCRKIKRVNKKKEKNDHMTSR
ncbi:MAG: flavodoxin [archaeon]